ncbi:DgyrCDS252 [Dimorphilus gyrociliatus]|uniref:DgyrCDS252 n=1 Tax=Dimorphilus gyrociliatus TaxID=2664684 RepID=A0A7I8V5R5_9ANNE|nr:DgyrCDS252 [Dimorphilus gyrociliatus]
MILARFVYIFLILLNICYVKANLPQCKPNSDFHYEYTECDSQGKRWRVQVPEFDKCTGGSPQPPERAPDCNVRCKPGQYLDKDIQKCKDCTQGSYSLDGGKRYDTWNEIPKDFDIKVEYFANFDAEENTTCPKSAGWIGKKDYIVAQPDSCMIRLTYVANLVKEGSVTFRYLYDTATTAYFAFSVTNQMCQRQNDQRKSLTRSSYWVSQTVRLNPGLNFLTWKVVPLDSRSDELQHSIFIQSIEITGLAFVSECTDCPAGSYSDQPKSVGCKPCPINTFSDNLGSISCQDCEKDSYSFEGHTKCIKKLPCREDDYKMVDPVCKQNKTELRYAWLEPKICNSEHKDSVALPETKTNQDCPPCNPGMELVNGICQFCSNGYYSENGSGPCIKCPSTKKLGDKQLIIQNFDSISKGINMSTSCLDTSLSFCRSNISWKSNGDFMKTTDKNGYDTYSILTIKVFGFAEPKILAGETIYSNIEITYDTSCEENCNFLFMTLNNFTRRGLSEKLAPSKTKTTHSSRLNSEQYPTLMWAFQKSTPSDYARIYQIRITNVINGGATRCSNCTIKDVKNAICDQCPPGQVISNGTECKPCPENNIVITNKKGESVCAPCAEGLKSIDGLKCVTTCKFQKHNGKIYDFTKMASKPIEEETKYVDNKTEEFLEKETVSSSVCQMTVLPTSKPNEPPIITQPKPLGDILVNISSDPKPMNMLDKMKKARFDLPENPEDDTYFTFYSKHSSNQCKNGRYTIVILRCDVTSKIPGEIIPAGFSGTFDGCTFMFLWKSIGACPACTGDAYKEVVGECKNRKQLVSYIARDKHCLFLKDAPPETTRPCSPIPKWLYLAVGFIFFTGILLCSLLIYCWKKNRKLEYKYSKLIGKKGSNSDEAEMPAPETCALDSSEEEEFDSVKIVEGKGKRIFNKLLGKTKSNPFESINLTSQEKEPLT